MKKIIPFAILFIFLVGCHKEKNRICELYEKPVGYAVGTIDYSTSVPGKTTYVYFFEIHGDEYKGKYKDYGIGQDNSRLIGKQFVVIFELSDPSNSNLNTNYFIQSDQDFLDFTDEYLDGPPDPKFPRKCK